MLFNIGHIINNKYKIIDWIGDGGFGEIYKIQDLTSNDVKALKCLMPQLVEENAEVADSFDKEAKAARQVENKNVVKIFTIGETVYRNNQIKYFIMEYAEEGDLDKFLKSQETYLSEEKLLDWMKQLLLGLKAVNEKLIHRDIKPKNILIFGNMLKISDFGLSRFIEESTRTLTFKGIGTPLYMAPEVWENLSPTISVDQYSMGMVFFNLTTLRHPFSSIPSSGGAIEFLRDNHLFTMPKQPKELNPELPKKLNSIIMRMIEKRPENRFTNLDEILNALENIQNSEHVDVSPNISEIVDIAQKSEQKIKEEELKIAQERKKQKEVANKIKKIFDFHCNELISSFDKVIDNINIEIKSAEIKKSRWPSPPSMYKIDYDFHGSSLKVFIAQIEGVNEVENVIGWGYCYVRKNHNGFNLLIQQSPDGLYAKWLACTIKDHALYNFAQHLNPHAVTSIEQLNEGLRGLRVAHIYVADLKEFNKDMFIKLVKKLVSL